MKKTYECGCHCGAVRFQANIDWGAGTTKCNCSICSKARYWFVNARPEDFRLLRGEAELSEYTFGAKRIHHLFCRHCGIKCFGWADIAELGGKFYAVTIACLENLNIDDVLSGPVLYLDGRNDNWQSPPAETRHL